MNRIAVIRIKGPADIRKDIEDTLENLRLTRINYCSIVDDGASYIGMLQKVKDCVTWGVVDKEDVIDLLKNRGELNGKKKLTEACLKENTKYGSIENFAEAFIKFQVELDSIPGLKLFFRLHPPRKGHKGIKRSFIEGGALGPRDNIKNLLHRMR